MGIQDRDYMRRRGRDDDDRGDGEDQGDGGSLRSPDALAVRMGRWLMIGAIALAVVVIVVLALTK
jgi:hypothetical protein